MDLKSLTKAEEQIMQIIWRLQQAVIKDVVAEFTEPRPAYTTVATVLSVLEKKGFVSQQKIGNTKLFEPEVSKHEYTRFAFSALLGKYFGGSFPKMASFFAQENDLDIEDLEKILKETEQEMSFGQVNKRQS